MRLLSHDKKLGERRTSLYALCMEAHWSMHGESLTRHLIRAFTSSDREVVQRRSNEQHMFNNMSNVSFPTATNSVYI